LKKLLIAAGGIVLVGGGAIAIILSTGGDASGPDLPPVSGAEPPPPVNVTLGPLPSIDAQGNLRTVEAAPPVEFEPPPAPPPDDSWEAIPAAARPARLGPVGRVMVNELATLQPRIGNCFDEDVQARHGQVAVSRPLVGGRTADQSAATLLILNLEVTPGQIRIVDAPVESQGRDSDGVIACAQGILRGHVIQTTSAQKVERARMIFQLNP
jgi:hypothetical protein